VQSAVALRGVVIAYTFVVAATWLVAIAVTIDNLRIRSQLKKLKQVQADLVEAALSNSVMVDGVELPLPSDERWQYVQMKNATNDEKVPTIRIGGVMTGLVDVWVGVESPAMPRTVATKNYCSAVWKAYRSRVARKAIQEQP
jgi:hypothetical protein